MIVHLIGGSALAVLTVGIMSNQFTPMLLGCAGVLGAALLDRPAKSIEPKQPESLPRDFAQQTQTLGDPHQSPYALAQAEMFQHARDIRHVQRHWRGES